MKHFHRQSIIVAAIALLGMFFFSRIGEKGQTNARAGSVIDSLFALPQVSLEMPVGTGLNGEYFANPNLTDSKLVRVDATVDFDWGLGSPDPSLGVDHYSAQWMGLVQPLYSEEYTFFVEANDGARLWINNNLLIDQWSEHPAAQKWSGKINLVAGKLYELKLEYYDETGDASVNLGWASARQIEETIPTGRLYPVHPKVSFPKDLYLTYDEDFNDLDDWLPINLIASFPTSGTVQLTLPEAITTTWGKIERVPLAYIPVDLYRFPILRVSVPEVSGGAKWKLYLYKTYPEWQAFELQSITASTGVYDYNVPMISGWNGNQRLQVILIVEGPAGGEVTFDGFQLGSYTQPAAPADSDYGLFARVSAVLADSPANTYYFAASGEKVYADNRSESYPWVLYEWDFGDGTVGSGQNITHTYANADNSIYLPLVQRNIQSCPECYQEEMPIYSHSQANGRAGPYHVTLKVTDAQGNVEYAFKDVGVTKSLYADYFVGYKSREFSGRSDIWWWYEPEKAPWSRRPADLYESGSTQKKQSIAFYNPLIGYYDQWDPATIEYTILLSKMVGIDGFAFEYQDNILGPAASLMPKFLHYAQKYDLKMTAQLIPSTMYDWYKDKVTTRSEMLEMGKQVIANLTQNYILPSGATYRLGGVERPVWFLYSWDRNQSLPDSSLPYTHPSDFGYTQDEINQLRSYATSQSGGVNPLILAAAWSFWPAKWDADSGEAFPLAGIVDGMYGWMKPDFEQMAGDDSYYLSHAYPAYPGWLNTDYIGTVAQNLAYFDKEYAETARLIATGEFTVTSGTVFPGFDDAYNGAWGMGRRRYVPPEDANGYTIDQTFDRFITNQTDIGMFATFADWAEGTTLEPTQELGFAVAIRAAKEIAAWKGLPPPSDEFLNSYLPYVVDIYNLRQQYNFLLRAGYNDAELKAFQQDIDAIIPPLLAKDLDIAQTQRDAAKMQYVSLLSALSPHDLTLEWVDEAQGASPTAGSLPLTMSETGSSMSFSLPYPVRVLLDSGAYTGTVSFEYQDAGTSFMSASVNTLAAFGASSGETTEILKLQKTNSGDWCMARSDFVNAAFDLRFNDRPDITFQTQGSLAYVDNFTHTTNALTVGYWVNPDLLTDGLQNQILMINPNSGEETLVARINNSYREESTPGLLEAYVNLGNGIQTITITNAFAPGDWTHVAIVWDGVGDQFQVYLNGTLRGAKPAGGAVLTASTQQILIGAITNGLDGAIDDLQIYNRALAANEIEVLTDGGYFTVGLEGYWKFDEGTGKMVEDISGRKHPAFLYNGAGWTTDVPFATGNPAALALVGDSTGMALRRVKIELKAYQKRIIPNFIPAFDEDFSDVSDWVTTTVSVSTDGNLATVTVPISPTWGKLERFETGYIKVDLDQNPILRVTVTEATAMWKIVLFDTVTWQPKTVKFLSTETGTLDYDLKKITEWSGGPKTLQLQLIVDGGAGGGGRYVKFDGLSLGRYTALPDSAYGFVEDFSDVSKWVASQASLSTDGQKATLTVEDDQPWGQMERLSPGQLITVNLDQYPILQTYVVTTTGTWQLFVLDANDNWRSYELQTSTSQSGLLEYNIPALTGLSGLKTVQVKYVVEGTSKLLTVDDLRFRQSDHPADWYIGYQENFNDISDWNLVDLDAVTADGTVTFTVASGKLWGKAERLEYGRLIWVDLDRYPILRLDAPAVNGTWKLVLYNATTWEEKLIKPMSDEQGVLDFNIKDITGWSGNEVPLQVSIILDSVEGYYPGAYIKLADLQFRRDGMPLPNDVFLQEDFSEVSDWETEYLTLNSVDGVGVATIVAGNPNGPFGKMYRANPGRLFNVNLDDYPLLRIDVTEATALWKIVAYNVTNGWEEKYIKYSGGETGELDFNVKDLTGWSGKDVKLQLVIYLDGDVGQYVGFDTLQFRRAVDTLPENVWFEEDLEDVSNRITFQVALTTDNVFPYIGTMTITDTAGWGKIERVNQGPLVWVDLDVYGNVQKPHPEDSSDEVFASYAIRI